MYKVVSFIVIFTFVIVMLYFHNEFGHHHASDHSEAYETTAIPANESNKVSEK